MWMLNHGVADDNVHFQHSMLLVKELEEHDVQFVQHSYPDENHGLRGVSRYVRSEFSFCIKVSCLGSFIMQWIISGVNVLKLRILQKTVLSISVITFISS